jgi:hypothetical protein
VLGFANLYSEAGASTGCRPEFRRQLALAASRSGDARRDRVDYRRLERWHADLPASLLLLASTLCWRP